MSAPDIPYARHSVSEEDIRAVVDVLGSDWLTQGAAVGDFERAVAAYCGSARAVAVNSATSALHLACLAAGLGPGDVAWTSPNTFVATANCALMCGAGVDFVDIDPETLTMSASALERKLERARREGALPKVVLPVHFAGQSCAMERIAELARHYRFTVIEDAAHAIGGRYRGTRIGSCAYSAMTVFSFHAVKLITTGEGGMVLTNRPELADRLALLRSHGVTRDPALMVGESAGPWYYEQIELGFNFRMTDIQAALGASQLGRLDEFVSRRHELARRYDEAFRDLPLTTPAQHPDAHSARHLYVVRLTPGPGRKPHRQAFEELRGRGIQVNLHYIPVHTQPYYRRRGFAAGDFPEAERYAAEAVSLPLYVGLTDEAQERVIAAVRGVLS